LIPFLFC